MRDTFLPFSLPFIGEDEIAEVVDGVRERDRQRFEAQILGGLQAGRELLLSNAEEQAREGGVVTRASEPVILPAGENESPEPGPAAR